MRGKGSEKRTLFPRLSGVEQEPLRASGMAMLAQPFLKTICFFPCWKIVFTKFICQGPGEAGEWVDGNVTKFCQAGQAGAFDGALAQAAQGGCGVSFSGDVPDPSGHGAVQPGLGDPASAGGWAGWPTEGPANPHHSVIHPVRKGLLSLEKSRLWESQQQPLPLTGRQSEDRDRLFAVVRGWGTVVINCNRGNLS